MERIYKIGLITASCYAAVSVYSFADTVHAKIPYLFLLWLLEQLCKLGRGSLEKTLFNLTLIPTFTHKFNFKWHRAKTAITKTLFTSLVCKISTGNLNIYNSTYMSMALVAKIPSHVFTAATSHLRLVKPSFFPP